MAFRLFNAHLDKYLGENDVKSRFRFGRDSINYLADLLSDDQARTTAFQYALLSPWALTIQLDLLSDDQARNTAFRYALLSPWALTIQPKIARRISGNFHGQMIQSLSSVEDDNCLLGIFQ